jgi:hypothetical protein
MQNEADEIRVKNFPYWHRREVQEVYRIARADRLNYTLGCSCHLRLIPPSATSSLTAMEGWTRVR